MRGKSIITVGFVAMMTVTVAVNVSDSLAADVTRGEGEARIGHGGSTYQPKFDGGNDCQNKVEKAERIGAGGSTYSSSQADGTGVCVVAGESRSQVEVIERIGAGGSTYSFRKPLAQMAGH